jgi:hypothetical protein
VKHIKKSTRAVVIWAALGLFVAGAAAQELSPRAYWPAPKGTKGAVFGYSYSFGDVATDPSMPVYGVDSRIHTGFFAYRQTLSLWGRTSNLLVELPCSRGTTVGTLDGEPRRRDFSGRADLGITLSVNLLGAPSMSPAEFRELRRNPRPILGASVKVLFPTGRYEEDKLINVGANRWAARAELGYMVPIKPAWLLEFDLGTWFFGDNVEFLGVTREQEPVFSAQMHVVRRIRPGFWAALDVNYFTGGRSTVGGELRADLQRNSRIGGTVLFPFRKRHAVKAGYSTGLVTESGGDFETFLLSYQFVLR